MPKHRRQLDTSVGVSGPHDFAVRSPHASSWRRERPSHPVPTVRDDRETPLMPARDAQTGASDLPDGTTEMPVTRWHDGQISAMSPKWPTTRCQCLWSFRGASKMRARNPSGHMIVGRNGFRTAAIAASGMTMRAPGVSDDELDAVAGGEPISQFVALAINLFRLVLSTIYWGAGLVNGLRPPPPEPPIPHLPGL